MKVRLAVAPVAAVLALLVASPAAASLTTFQQYVGNYNVSTDGFGSTSAGGQIQASVPVGATVVAAYLYTSTFSTAPLPGVTFQGVSQSFTSLGVANGFLQAGRSDVTSIVKPIIDVGPGGTYNFNITEASSSATDGEALVVVYQLGSLPVSTIGILDGFSQSAGDSAHLDFAGGLDTSAGFFAEMYIGDGFSFDGSDPLNPSNTNQTSTIRVNGNIMTNVAGHCDDAADASCSNGNLITVGGFNDPFTPSNPLIAQDHEHYNLVPFIANGDTTILVTTLNPSSDDNIFLEVFRVRGEGTVSTEPRAATAPEPATLTLVGAGALALVRRQRRKV